MKPRQLPLPRKQLVMNHGDELDKTPHEDKN